MYNPYGLVVTFKCHYLITAIHRVPHFRNRRLWPDPEPCDHHDSNSDWYSAPQQGSPTAPVLPLHGF